MPGQRMNGLSATNKPKGHNGALSPRHRLDDLDAHASLGRRWMIIGDHPMLVPSVEQTCRGAEDRLRDEGVPGRCRRFYWVRRPIFAIARYCGMLDWTRLFHTYRSFHC